MRALFFLLPFLLTGCAYEGVVVNKNSRPHPLYESIGVEEMSSVELRDNSGVVHRQMVTPEVYQRYARGDYFNDLQPPAGHGDSYQMEEPGVTARPIQPIAGGGQGLSGQGLTMNHQSGNKTVTSSVGTRRMTTVASRNGSTARRSAVASHTPASIQPTTKTAAVSQSKFSTPVPANTNTVESLVAPPSISSNASNPVAVASMAHFSAEVTSRGARSATLNATPETSASTAKPKAKPSSAHHTHKKTPRKPTEKRNENS